METNESNVGLKDRVLDNLLLGLIVILFLYQLWYIQTLPYETMTHTIIHLGLAVIVILIARLKEAKTRLMWMLLVLMGVMAVFSTVYLFTNYRVILSDPSYPPTMALITASVMTVICFLLVKWSFGLVFPAFGFAAVLYVLFGDVLPGAFSAPSTSVGRAVTLLAADVTSPWGSYGSLLELSANYLFLFIAFGAILNAFGGLKFVVQLGNIAANALRSGPAALSIITSALLGSVTGSSAANITVTGSFTIPLMKDSGYTPHQAAAIEAAASNGGQFLPPIMGATVFVMAAYTGIPYIEIMVAALVPALIYFFILLVYAETNAIKMDMQRKDYELDTKQMLFDAPRFVIPFGVLIFLLLSGFSLMRVVFWSTIVVIAVGVLYGLNKKTRLKWPEVKERFVKGILTASNVAVILALVGVVVAAIEITGLSHQLSMIFGAFAGDNVFVMLLLTMVASLILGVGLPTPAAYVIVATVLSPLLLRAGVPLLQAHLFPLFFAVISHLTPPIGIGLILASNLADASFKKSAIEVFKAAYVVVFLPFFFIYTPELLLDYETIYGLVSTIFAILLLFFTFSIFLNNHFKLKLNHKERLIMLGTTILTLLFIIFDNPLLLAIGVGGCILGLYLNKKRSEEKVSLVEN